MVFATDKVTGHLVESHHADMLHRYYTDNAEHLAPWEPKREADYHSLQAWQDRVDAFMEEHRQGLALRILALHNQSSEPVGVCNFTNIVGGPFQACYLGYSIADKYAGQGLMTEIVDQSVNYVFAEYRLHRIMANYMPENVASGRILEKLGFAREGLAKSYLKIDGAWRDHVLTAKINPAH